MEMQIFGSKYHILMTYQNGILFTLDIPELKNMLGLVLNSSPEHLHWNGRTLIIICLINSHFMLQKTNGIILIAEL